MKFDATDPHKLVNRAEGASHEELGKSPASPPVGLLRDSTSGVVFDLRPTTCRGGGFKRVLVSVAPDGLPVRRGGGILHMRLPLGTH